MMQGCFHQRYEHLHEIPRLGWLPSKVDKLSEGHVRLPTSQGNLSVEPISSNPEIFLIRFRPNESTWLKAAVRCGGCFKKQQVLTPSLSNKTPGQRMDPNCNLWRQKIKISLFRIDSILMKRNRWIHLMLPEIPTPNTTESIFWTGVCSIHSKFKRLWGWITRVNRNHSLKWRHRGHDLK